MSNKQHEIDAAENAAILEIAFSAAARYEDQEAADNEDDLKAIGIILAIIFIIWVCSHF